MKKITLPPEEIAMKLLFGTGNAAKLSVMRNRGRQYLLPQDRNRVPIGDADGARRNKPRKYGAGNRRKL